MHFNAQHAGSTDISILSMLVVQTMGMHFNAKDAGITDKPESISVLSMLVVQTNWNAFQSLACWRYRQKLNVFHC